MSARSQQAGAACCRASLFLLARGRAARAEVASARRFVDQTGPDPDALKGRLDAPGLGQR